MRKFGGGQCVNGADPTTGLTSQGSGAEVRGKPYLRSLRGGPRQAACPPILAPFRRTLGHLHDLMHAKKCYIRFKLKFEWAGGRCARQSSPGNRPKESGRTRWQLCVLHIN